MLQLGLNYSDQQHCWVLEVAAKIVYEVKVIIKSDDDDKTSRTDKGKDICTCVSWEPVLAYVFFKHTVDCRQMVFSHCSAPASLTACCEL